MIEIRGLRKSFGGLEVLRGADLDVADGEVLTLIGRERVAQGLADDALLIEAEALAAEAMRLD